jgi:putative SOS response-associated peptidase YedK
MCYSNSSTSKNVDLSKKYVKKIPAGMDETPIYFASGFSFPTWRIVTQEDTLQIMNWGLIPSWFKEQDFKEIASMTLNARIETVEEKASFKNLLHRQECIVPSSGFFEWQTIGKEKIPFFIYPAKGEILSLAGLFDQWQDPISGKIKKTFTVLTCPANELMTEIHNSKKRMPVILKAEQEKDWLEGKLDLDILQNPVDSAFIKAHEVNRKLVASKNQNSLEVQLPFKNDFLEQESLF